VNQDENGVENRNRGCFAEMWVQLRLQQRMQRSPGRVIDLNGRVWAESVVLNTKFVCLRTTFVL
jgi:hypothetical protein